MRRNEIARIQHCKMVKRRAFPLFFAGIYNLPIKHFLVLMPLASSLPSISGIHIIIFDPNLSISGYKVSVV